MGLAPRPSGAAGATPPTPREIADAETQTAWARFAKRGICGRDVHDRRPGFPGPPHGRAMGRPHSQGVKIAGAQRDRSPDRRIGHRGEGRDAGRPTGSEAEKQQKNQEVDWAKRRLVRSWLVQATGRTTESVEKAKGRVALPHRRLQDDRQGVLEHYSVAAGAALKARSVRREIAEVWPEKRESRPRVHLK